MHFKEIIFCANHTSENIRMQLQKQKYHKVTDTTTRNEYLLTHAWHKKSFVILTCFTQSHQEILLLIQVNSYWSLLLYNWAAFSSIVLLKEATFIPIFTACFDTRCCSTSLTTSKWNHRYISHLGLCQMHFSRIYLQVSNFNLSMLDQTPFWVAHVSTDNYPKLQVIWETTLHLNEYFYRGTTVWQPSSTARYFRNIWGPEAS